MPRYRMLPRAELIEELAGGGGEQGRPGLLAAALAPRPRPTRHRRAARERAAAREPRREPKNAPPEPAPAAAAAAGRADASARSPARRRRRRRAPCPQRRPAGARPRSSAAPDAGRQAIAYADTRAGCALCCVRSRSSWRASKGPDPVVVLIDPSPEELADWRPRGAQGRDRRRRPAAPRDDAMAQAANRPDGEDMFLLVDSLTRLARPMPTPARRRSSSTPAARRARRRGSLTVVAAVERRERD